MKCLLCERRFTTVYILLHLSYKLTVTLEDFRCYSPHFKYKKINVKKARQPAHARNGVSDSKTLTATQGSGTVETETRAPVLRGLETPTGEWKTTQRADGILDR